MGGVEGLRGVAAAGVLLSHVYLYASPDGGRYDLGPIGLLPRTSGTAGVVLFFTLSGFLLYRPFAAAVLARTRAPSVRAYLRNRALRIFPAYWFALLGAGLLLRTTYLPALTVERRSLAADPEVFVANLLLVQGYTPATVLTGVGPAWSLVVEVAFYGVLPLLAVLAALLATRTALGRRRPWLAVLVPAGLLVGLGQAGWRLVGALPATADGTWGGSWHAVVARSFLAHAGLFAAGMVLAVLHAQVTSGALVLPVRWRPAAWTVAALVGLPALVGFDRRALSENLATLALSLSFALLLALVVLPRPRPSRLVRALESAPLQWSGLVSYGVFLWHEPLVWFLRLQGWTGTGRGGFLLALLSVGVSAGAVALLSWRLVERPALALKRARTSAQTEGGLGSAEQGADPAHTRARSAGTPTPSSDGTTSRRGAAAKPTPATLGTATTAQPAASPAATPAGESSITTHRDGSAPSS